MNFSRTRGQSALEYLVTYGWAILAIVIIAGVLWYFGIFNPTRFAGDKQCGGFGAFICQDFKVSAANGNLTIVLNNKAGGTINSVNISTGTTNTCGPTSIAANANTTCWSVVNSGGTSGNSFDQLTVTITYTDARSAISHTDAGFIRGKFE